MEDTLRGTVSTSIYTVLQSLNPCFNGRYSQRPYFISLILGAEVLILVLMEDTLRVHLLRL